ncbi:hypothetical protein V2J09_021207 [Rumex salicifolius]
MIAGSRRSLGSRTFLQFDDDDVQGIFDELMEAKALTLPEPKRPNEDIIEGMINKGEIEVEGGKFKGPSASSNVISTIKEMKISPPFHYPIGPYLFIFKWEMRPGLGYPTLYEVVTSPQIINELSNDEHLSEWHTVAE